MAMAMALAGYTAAEADALRRTMGHERKRARLDAALDRLRVRMVAQGIAESVAAQLAEELHVFGNYGFPESHAWSFALIAYATAWLKAHHPAAFYAGLFNAQPMGFYSIASLVHEARRRGVEVRLPCLALGTTTCTLEERDDTPDAPALRMGWRFVRGLGDTALARLTAARAAAPFTSMRDVVTRAHLTRAEAGALARAHAFSVWTPDRRQAGWHALGTAADVLPLAPVRSAGAEEATASRDDGGDGHVAAACDPHAEVLADYHALGLSTAGHPMGGFRAWCTRMGVRSSEALRRARTGERVLAAGLVTVRQRPSTSKGTVFMLLEDEWGCMQVIVPARVDARDREAVRQSQFALVYGRAEHSATLVNVVAERVEPLMPDARERAHRAADAPALSYRSYDFR